MEKTPMEQREINNLNIGMAGMKKDIEFIKDSLVDNKSEHREILLKIDAWIDSSEKKFAPMWTATAIKFTMAVIMTGVIGAILSLVFIQ